MARKGKNGITSQGGEAENRENVKILVDALKDIPPALVATPPIFFFLMWQLGRRLKDPFLSTAGWGCMLLSITESEVAEGAVMALMGADLGVELSGLTKEDAADFFKRYFTDYKEAARLLAAPVPTLSWDAIKEILRKKEEGSR